MLLSAVKTLSEIVCTIRRIQQHTVSVKISRLHFEHGFCRLHCRYDIFHVTAFHYKSLIRYSGNIVLVKIHLFIVKVRYSLFAAGKECFFRYTGTYQCLYGILNCVLCILKLQIKKFLHSTNGSLL